eukprot:sb/3461182/
MKLHFFPEVLSNMALVERVLTAPGGSLLLAGRSGSEKCPHITIYHFQVKSCKLGYAQLGHFYDLRRWYDAVSGSDVGSSSALLLAWAYEARRLFRDKLAASAHVDKFDGILSTVLRSDWGVDITALDKKQFVTHGDTSGVAMASSHGKSLGPISFKDYKEIIAKGAKVYGREVREMKLHFFPEVLSNMALVERVLTAPGGSLLLAGRSGVGRRTAVSVISHMHRMTVITPKVSRNYSMKQLKLDLKGAVQQAGVEGEQIVLLLEDHQLLDPAFLESINSLLCSGEIPGLFAPEELDVLLGPLKDKMEGDFSGTVNQFFTRQVLKNLHVVFILDSANPNFRTKCEANPALYTKCEFVWLESWAPGTMSRLPRMVIPELDKEKSKFHIIHSGMQPSATPREYLNTLEVYNSVLDNKKKGIKGKQDHLTAGVTKLDEAKALVDDLKAKAAVKSKVLAEKQLEADEALNEITTRIQQASENKQEMEVLKGKLAEETVKLEQRKKAIDIELQDIQPLVDEAKAAVGNIKSEDLSEIRSLRAPPDVIRDILEGVLQLMGIFDTSWVSMRSFLAKRGVKEEIISFDARKIQPDIRNAVEKLLTKNSKSFDPKIAKRASKASAPLASWVKANVQFSIVLEKIGNGRDHPDYLQLWLMQLWLKESISHRFIANESERDVRGAWEGHERGMGGSYDAVSGSDVGSSSALLLAWAYEARRLFRDKLAASAHVDKFDGILSTVLRSDWGVDITALDKKQFVTHGDTSGVAMASSHGKSLGPISFKDYKEIIAKGAKVYGREVREMKLHFFPEVLSNMALVERVLTAPGGSLLLAGRSGVGRRTAVSVISHMHRMTVITPKVSRNYSMKQLKLDLKGAVQQAGVEGEQIVLLLEDHQLLDPAFLESINSLLCSGEIPGLFAPEELDVLLGVSTEKTKCEANPALYTKCEFVWLESWAPGTMSRLPRMVIPELDKEKSKFHIIHSGMQPSATPREYLNTLEVYNSVLDNKKKGIKGKQDHLTAGVTKLDEAKALVDDLKAKAAVKSKVLAEKQLEADEALNEITTRIQQASENKQEMEVLKGKLAEETVKLEQRKKAIDIELQDIQPLVDEAKAAVGNIKSEDLSEIRSLRAPPDVIRDILEGVLQLMGIFDTSWVSMRSFLAKRGVKEEIISFDARKIQPDIRNAVEKLLTKNSKSFDPKIAKRASKASAPLASWVKANVQFSIVLEKIGKSVTIPFLSRYQCFKTGICVAIVMRY